MVFGSNCSLCKRKVNNLEVIGHRGDPYKKVENTVESIRSAFRNGDAAEVDLQLSKDGIIVLYHDDFLGQAGFFVSGDKQKQVCEYTLSELQSATPHIPRLDEILPIAKDKKMYLELKCLGKTRAYKTKLVKSVLDWIEKNKVSNQVVISSFDPECLLYVNESNPNLCLGIASKDVTEKNITEVVTLSNLAKVQYLFPPFKITTSELTSRCKEKNIKIAPWVWKENIEEEKEELKRLISLRVDGIITNQPGELSKMLFK